MSVSVAIANGSYLPPVHQSGKSVMYSKVDPIRKLATAIMSSEVTLAQPDMGKRCFGCGGTCFAASSCTFSRTLNQAAYDNKHCQACLMPLNRVGSLNMHPSCAGWKDCSFKYKEVIRKYLLLAHKGVDIKITLPAGFPTNDPERLVEWIFSSQSPGKPPNIVMFMAALLGIQ
jgi:hypothetical protein